MDDKYRQYFDQAKGKLRFTGVGGQSLPNPDLTQDPVDPIKVDPKRQIVTDKGWVMVGGKTVKQVGPKKNSSAGILPISSKIIDQRRKDASQKDQKSNESN
jgi:hypothetical protein